MARGERDFLGEEVERDETRFVKAPKRLPLLSSLHRRQQALGVITGLLAFSAAVFIVDRLSPQTIYESDFDGQSTNNSVVPIPRWMSESASLPADVITSFGSQVIQSTEVDSGFEILEPERSTHSSRGGRDLSAQTPLPTAAPQPQQEIAPCTYGEYIAKHFDNSLWNVMCGIAGAESGFDTLKIHKNPDGSFDYGFLQINQIHAGKVGGNLLALLDPDTNARVGREVYQERKAMGYNGLSAWAVCGPKVKCW